MSKKIEQDISKNKRGKIMHDVVRLISKRVYKAGYVVKEEEILTPGGTGTFVMRSAYNPNGDYIGDAQRAYRLCKVRGIAPELADPDHNSCSIGFCEKDQKFFGWSHRAIYGFGIGHVVKEGDCTNSSGWTDEYLAEHPEEDISLPVGFTAKNLDDCKRLAIAFADSVG